MIQKYDCQTNYPTRHDRGLNLSSALRDAFLDSKVVSSKVMSMLEQLFGCGGDGGCKLYVVCVCWFR